MDFFEAQDAARRRTGRLIALFGAAVVGIVAVVYGVTHLALGRGAGPVDPILLLQVTLAVGAVVGLGSVSRTVSLRRGGPAVAELLGGRRLAPDTEDPDERRMLNVVEEISIASGTPVPTVYLLEGEDGINAFAAGYSMHDAAVAVTRGALTTLSRDELQGVVAHEFSHILNGDMRLNIRLIGVLYGILLLGVIGRGIIYFGPRGGVRRGGRDGGGGMVVLVGLALFLVGYIGVFFGKLIKAAVSRQREYLADSAAVEFTRNPDGLAGALKKIGAATEGSRIQNPHAEELSHLFFANGLHSSLLSALATHPPLEDRIRRLDPGWQGDFDAIETHPPRAARSTTTAALHGFEEVAAAAPPTASPTEPSSRMLPDERARAPHAAQRQPATGPMVVASSVGAPTRRDLTYAADLLADLPETLDQAVHDPAGAVAVVFALVISGAKREEDDKAWSIIRAFDPEGVEGRVRMLLPVIRAQGADARLPIVDLCLPALRRLESDDRTRVPEVVGELIRADETVRLFDFALLHILARNLADPNRQDRGGSRITSFAAAPRETEALLSAIAWAGSGWEPGAARTAFSAGARHLPSGVGKIELVDPAALSLDNIDQALSVLQYASPGIRRRLLEACTVTAAHDRLLEPVERQLLRAVAEALDCPLPPLSNLV